MPTARRLAAARCACASSRAWTSTGTSGRTKAAFVANDEPSTGTFTAPGR
jgi:hypothetical protein